MGRYYIGTDEMYPVYDLMPVDEDDPDGMEVPDAVVEMVRQAQDTFNSAQSALGFLKRQSETST